MSELRCLRHDTSLSGAKTHPYAWRNNCSKRSRGKQVTSTSEASCSCSATSEACCSWHQLRQQQAQQAPAALPVALMPLAAAALDVNVMHLQQLQQVWASHPCVQGPAAAAVHHKVSMSMQPPVAPRCVCACRHICTSPCTHEMQLLPPYNNLGSKGTGVLTIKRSCNPCAAYSDIRYLYSCHQTDTASSVVPAASACSTACAPSLCSLHRRGTAASYRGALPLWRQHLSWQTARYGLPCAT
jgi:hypothetical protein